MKYKTYPRFRSFDFTDVIDRLTELEPYEQIQARTQLVRDQLARSEQELSDRMGEEKYQEWRAVMIRPLDDPGEILVKVDAELARLGCGECPFDFEPSFCGMCNERGLGVK